MKTALALTSGFVLACALAAPPSVAMPRLAQSATAYRTTPSIEKTRLVCDRHRCWRVGGYRYYRPYGYYRPYYYGPRLGIGVGPFGVRIF